MACNREAASGRFKRRSGSSLLPVDRQRFLGPCGAGICLRPAAAASLSTKSDGAFSFHPVACQLSPTATRDRRSAAALSADLAVLGSSPEAHDWHGLGFALGRAADLALPGDLGLRPVGNDQD